MTLSAQVLPSLEHVDDDVWESLAGRGAVDMSVFTTPQWQRSWWTTFGRGALLPVLVSRGDSPLLLASVFIDGDMAFFVGAGGSDYLDFIGATDDADVVGLAIETVLGEVPDLLGLRFHHVPDGSPTGGVLARVADRLGLDLFDEGHLVAPYLDMAYDRDAARETADKRSLVRHDRWFRREGGLKFEHFAAAADIVPHLDEFFDQHVERWKAAGIESQFTDEAQREFFVRVAIAGGEGGWVRFTRVVWDGRLIAGHFGFSHRGRFVWYKPTFDLELARRSPGEVLLRSLLLEALDQGVSVFDFGLGDEAFKQRFATGARTVRTWGLYPPSSER